ncbi:MAG TPA: ATP-binding protein [Candidatus Acidoferrales bacterium]|nr:ATP-binding protein [Candidatus Acidoferrales bacterium]
MSDEATPFLITKSVADTMIQLNDEDVLLRLTNTEDSTVERKTASDYRDCRRTAVAFSNSLPVGDPGIIFVGVRDDGTPEEKNNLESLQKKVSEEMNRIYPPIYPQMKVMTTDGKEFLVIIVRGSENRPHFAGQAFVREGTRSVPSSEKQFGILIAERNSKVREIRKWRGRVVTVQCTLPRNPYAAHVLGTSGGKLTGTISECNQFYVTVESTSKMGSLISFPLGQIEINFDHQSKCLELRLLD